MSTHKKIQMHENEIVEAEQNINSSETNSETVSQNENEVATTEKLAKEISEQKDKYLRLMAEFENYKRRTSKERIELIQTAGKDIIISLLEVLDDIDRAEKQLASSDDVAVQKEGIQLVFNKIKTNLQSKGVKAMESVNTDFDVEKHEAITEIPAPSEDMKGKVLDEITKGYYLNDKLIRFAKVVVAN